MMMLAASALSLKGWKCQISAVTCPHPHSSPRTVFRISAAKNNERKRRRSRDLSKGPASIAEEASPSNGENPIAILDLNGDADVTGDEKAAGAPRGAVLQSCTLTSGLLLAVGLLLRQASHVASSNGLPFADPMAVSFNFETWHLELIAGLVILISSTRYILLQTWPDFRDSSEAANTQILTSLESLDYIVVACLPGISEELLFRGALMPTFGLNWLSALATGVFFGVLHLGNGRKYPFAIWATFVGLAYGLATIASSSIIVPMASHSINNIIGGLLWRFRDNSERDTS